MHLLAPSLNQPFFLLHVLYSLLYVMVEMEEILTTKLILSLNDLLFSIVDLSREPSLDQQLLLSESLSIMSSLLIEIYQFLIEIPPPSSTTTSLTLTVFNFWTTIHTKLSGNAILPYFFCATFIHDLKFIGDPLLVFLVKTRGPREGQIVVRLF